MIKDMYEIETYCSCSNCKTVHVVNVEVKNDTEVHHVSCHICNNHNEYLEHEIKIIKQDCLFCSNAFSLDNGNLMCVKDENNHKEVSTEYVCLNYEGSYLI